jgi:hypothetical protein
MFTGNTFRIASILGGSSWHSLASIRISKVKMAIRDLLNIAIHRKQQDMIILQVNQYPHSWQKLTIDI